MVKKSPVSNFSKTTKSKRRAWNHAKIKDRVLYFHDENIIFPDFPDCVWEKLFTRVCYVFSGLIYLYIYYIILDPSALQVLNQGVPTL